MTITAHAARLAVVLVLLAAPRAQAVPLGIFDEAVHDHVEIVFEFAPFTPSGLLHLGLGLASSLVPPSPGYAGCSFTLSVGGSQVSSVLHPSIFGCQGWWTSGDGTGVSDVAPAPGKSRPGRPRSRS